MSQNFLLKQLLLFSTKCDRSVQFLFFFEFAASFRLRCFVIVFSGCYTLCERFPMLSGRSFSLVPFFLFDVKSYRQAVDGEQRTYCFGNWLIERNIINLEFNTRMTCYNINNRSTVCRKVQTF